MPIRLTWAIAGQKSINPARNLVSACPPACAPAATAVTWGGLTRRMKPTPRLITKSNSRSLTCPPPARPTRSISWRGCKILRICMPSICWTARALANSTKRWLAPGLRWAVPSTVPPMGRSASSSSTARHCLSRMMAWRLPAPPTVTLPMRARQALAPAVAQSLLPPRIMYAPPSICLI